MYTPRSKKKDKSKSSATPKGAKAAAVPSSPTKSAAVVPKTSGPSGLAASPSAPVLVSCPSCTFENPAYRTKCEMCQSNLLAEAGSAAPLGLPKPPTGISKGASQSDDSSATSLGGASRAALSLQPLSLSSSVPAVIRLEAWLGACGVDEAAFVASELASEDVDIDALAAATRDGATAQALGPMFIPVVTFVPFCGDSLLCLRHAGAGPPPSGHRRGAGCPRRPRNQSPRRRSSRSGRGWQCHS